MCLVSLTESRDGEVVIALPSHLHGPVRSGLSWLLVLYSAPKGFSPGSPVFPSPKKSTSPNSNSIGCRTSHFRVSGASWINIDNQLINAKVN